MIIGENLEVKHVIIVSRFGSASAHKDRLF